MQALTYFIALLEPCDAPTGEPMLGVARYRAGPLDASRSEAHEKLGFVGLQGYCAVPDENWVTQRVADQLIVQNDAWGLLDAPTGDRLWQLSDAASGVLGCRVAAFRANAVGLWLHGQVGPTATHISEPIRLECAGVLGSRGAQAPTVCVPAAYLELECIQLHSAQPGRVVARVDCASISPALVSAVGEWLLGDQRGSLPALPADWGCTATSDGALLALRFTLRACGREIALALINAEDSAQAVQRDFSEALEHAGGFTLSDDSVAYPGITLARGPAYDGARAVLVQDLCCAATLAWWGLPRRRRCGPLH